MHVLATKTEYVSPSSRTSSTELQRLEALSTVSSTHDCVDVAARAPTALQPARLLAPPKRHPQLPDGLIVT